MHEVVARGRLTRFVGCRGDADGKAGPGEEGGMVERLFSERMMGADCPRFLITKEHFGPETGRDIVERA
jgi:hypothetical protein